MVNRFHLPVCYSSNMALHVQDSIPKGCFSLGRPDTPKLILDKLRNEANLTAILGHMRAELW
jgi:hypothetical protein